MTNFEFYKDEIKKIRDENFKCCFFCELMKNIKDCSGMSCPTRKELTDWLCKEYKKPIKLKQWEYDVLKAVKNHNQSAYRFNDSSILKQLVNKGYFKSVDDTRNEIKCTIIQDVLDNCIIVEDDYEGFEECK